MTTMNSDIEQAITQLLEACKANNISISGSIADKHQLIGFEHFPQNTSTLSEEFKNISALVHSKGNIEKFLCVISMREEHSVFAEENNNIKNFTNSNQQVLITHH
jgi:hypothetical protein